MAAVTATQVTKHEIWKSGGTSGRKYKYLEVTIALSSQGGLTNSVGKALFGLSSIKGCSDFRDSSSVVIAAAPSFDGSLLVFYTIETNGNPADKTATVKGVVWGLE